MLLAQLPSEESLRIQISKQIREALALLFQVGTQGMARLLPFKLSQHQILLQNHFKAALAAFRRGSFRSIAL